MKFAQYLSDTQTPEWKKAYIDYRGLKKRISAIRKSHEGLSFHVLDSDDSPDEVNTPPAAPRPSDADADSGSFLYEINAPTHSEELAPDANSPLTQDVIGTGRAASATKDQKSSIRRKLSWVARSKNSSRMNNGGNNHTNPLDSLPLHELLTQLSPVEVSFFTLLDAQLDKVESFYLAREKEMLSRGHTLQIQLNELNDHRKLFHDTHKAVPWKTSFVVTIRSKIGLNATLKSNSLSKLPSKTTSLKSKLTTEARSLRRKSAANAPPVFECGTAQSSALAPIPAVLKIGGKQRYQEGAAMHAPSEEMSADEPRVLPYSVPLSADPDSYLYAKRKLKKAVSEHYRGLEVLHNYRVLNITGFRKALKKFEKVTKIPVQHQYMTEKVEKSAFASDKAVRQMMNQMEEMYAKAFARGDRKRATKRLRAGNSSKNHHFSAFRSGVFIGLAFPALVDGLVKVFQPQTREALPRWDILLYFYSLILVPVLFSLLVGFNLLVWANSRINYAFIFELDVPTQLDHREYFEIPSLLLAALTYAFWLSFSRIGAPAVSPTIWPLVWLAFAFFVIFEPLPVLFRPSRYWLVRNVARLFVSGTKHVEFTDFWMGDQFCSLIFTISNLYFFVCVYVDKFSPDFRKCAVATDKWPIPFALASVPFLIRLIQSVKRYVDSGLITHLINGGKYGCGIIAYLFYFMWRSNQINHGAVFALWCLTSAFYSLYALSWDLLMDWSVLRLHSTHILLRPELVYANHTAIYYFAIISNALIRFIWVIYIPKGGPNMMVRTFIVGFLEMLRRWQWNFFRLENEHLGNMDQYRVTREVPLPYAVDDRNRDYDNDDDDDHLKVKR